MADNIQTGSSPAVPSGIAATPGHYRAPESVRVGNISIEFDVFGSADAPPLLLIMGLGCQMIVWDERFCAQLAARGYRVIRFDNRDIGRSTRLDELGVPNLGEIFMSLMQGGSPKGPYLLRDMAADAVGLLDALNIDAAHVVGISMGGAIAQEMAINWPSRLRSLTCIMATTGEANLPPPTQDAMAILMTPSPTDREGFGSEYVRRQKVLRGADHPEDEATDVERAGRIFERGINPAGVARQLAATLASPPRADALRAVAVPTLVIHGDADPLVNVEGGKAIARAVPGARLVLVPGMGHALPVKHWATIIDSIAQHAT